MNVDPVIIEEEGEIESAIDDNDDYIDYSRKDKASQIRLKTTTLKHFGDFIDTMKAGNNSYQRIGWFKRSPDGAANPNFLELAVPLTVGKFADYLIKKNIKVSTCHSYLSSIKGMLQDAFIDAKELRESRWYSKTRANIIAVSPQLTRWTLLLLLRYYTQSQSDGTTISSQAPEMKAEDLSLMCELLLTHGTLKDIRAVACWCYNGNYLGESARLLH
jgi:hypothetical protein